MAPYYDTDRTGTIAQLLSPAHVSVVAHRGGSRLRPENTLAAFDHAAALGVHALECDVHLSRDGEPVVIHDPTLDRTTDARGPVADRTAAELARVDAGFAFRADGATPFRGTGLGVPRLAELLDRHPGLPVVIELKGKRAELADRVIAVLRENGAAGRVVVGGYDQGLLARVRRLAPDVPTSASADEVRSAVWRAKLWLPPRRRGYALIQAPYRLDGRPVFGRAFVRTARRADVPVQAWIIDAADEIRQLVDWGVTGIITDRPDVALQVVRGPAG